MRWLLLAALASPGFAQVVELPSFESAGPAHPLLTGSLADPASPLSANLALHLSAMAALESPESLSGYLGSSEGREPLDRASIAAAARLLAEPAAADRFFAESKRHPAAAAWNALRSRHPALELPRREGAPALAFDREAAKPSLELDGLVAEGGKLKLAVPGEDRKGRPVTRLVKLEPLGRGAFGVVYPHPRIEGAVLKLVDLTFDALFASGFRGPEDVAGHDERASRLLASADLGPRFLGRAILTDGRPPPKARRSIVLVKERIYGPTVQGLIDERRYGPEQHQVLLEGLDRMADARVRVGDMNPANFMIGRTLLRPDARFYHIDGGQEGTVAPEETRDGLRESLYRQTALNKWRVDRNVGMIETQISLSSMLEAALRRNQAKTRWERFEAWLSDLINNAYFPAK